MRRFAIQSIRAFVPQASGPYECPLVYPSVFSVRQCDRILGLAADLATDDAQVGDGVVDDEHHDEIRRSRIAWLPAEDPFAWIYDKLATVVWRANRHYDFDLIGFTEDLQLTEYEGAGAFYTWHQDGLDGELAIRKLSMVVQLSDPDDYDGGALEFFALDGNESDAASDRRTLMRQRGTVVVFPAFEYHRVTPLLSGTRRSLVCWVGGPAFRQHSLLLTSGIGQAWYRDYLPEAAALDRTTFPSIDKLTDWLGGSVHAEPILNSRDTPDQTLGSFWAHPERVLDDAARRATSAFARMEPAVLNRVVAAVERDLQDGEWDQRNGELRDRAEYDGGMRLLVSHR